MTLAELEKAGGLVKSLREHRERLETLTTDHLLPRRRLESLLCNDPDLVMYCLEAAIEFQRGRIDTTLVQLNNLGVNTDES